MQIDLFPEVKQEDASQPPLAHKSRLDLARGGNQACP